MKQGLVTQSTGKWYKVAIDDGEIINCRIPGKFRLKEEAVTNPVAVGDRVDVTIHDDGSGQIEEIHERRNHIPRQATHGRRGEQVLAANIDHAWVVQSVREPKMKPGFIDRFLVTCEAYQVRAGIIINKIDLGRDKDAAFIGEMMNLYEELGYPVRLTSIHDSESLATLEKTLAGQISVFIGPSGTGKSSLLNAIDPDLGLRTGEVSGSSQKGKHTTTFAQLLKIKSNGYIVDTPGIRELGVVNIEPYELSLFFPEMREPRERCKFYNCTHEHEPGCTVVKAFEEGLIHPERYNSYLNILDSLKE